ncbi:hypothetical protein [Halostreptopolyspora alba]|uniref:Uncharacterized protein n=1 Tax=Halostreptopolyspora alba TaxID=2487137 RepID=A0A3N0E735_9ACTN|nr:hypothetical protein EFW17_15095 [Nocardiopsaceae bacterium YIM 96095]
MTDRAKRRLDLAKVRVIGPPETVETVIEAITTALPAAEPSRPYASRRDPEHVRVYLEVTPE